MMQSPFAFYRGTAAIMAADLANTPVSGLRVQACGDAHLANFGGFATPERGLIFDVNDLDETLPAPWEWDVKRLTASVVLAGRHITLKHSKSARAATAAVRCYREHMAEYAFMKSLEVWYEKIDVKRLVNSIMIDEDQRARMAKRLAKARARSVAENDFPKLAEQVGSTPRIKDNPPLIFHHRESDEAMKSGDIKEAWALCTDLFPSMSARSLTAFIFAMLR